VRLTDLQSLLAESDVVTVHVPLTDETENMIAAREIAAMKPGVRIVNCARGGIIHEAQINVAVDVARQLVAFRDGELVEHAVNIPVGDRTAVAELRPWVALAERLGRFSVQLDPGHLASVEITLAGAIADADPELLALAVL